MDTQSQFHIAYRLAAHEHRIAGLERGLASFRRNAFRVAMFAILWLTGILTNSSSSRISELVNSGVNAALNTL